MPLPLFHRFVSLLLAVLVLTASVGFTVQRQTCRLSGRSQVSLSLPSEHLRDCGRVLTDARTSIKSSCCDFSSQHHKMSTATPDFSVSKAAMPTLETAWLPLLVETSNSAPTPARAPNGVRWFAADASPPPLGGRALLAFVGKLVV